MAQEMRGIDSNSIDFVEAIEKEGWIFFSGAMDVASQIAQKEKKTDSRTIDFGQRIEKKRPWLNPK